MKTAKARIRRPHNKVSRLMDLLVALNERRKYLETRILEREIMLECGADEFTAYNMRERQKRIEERADIDQTGI